MFVYDHIINGNIESSLQVVCEILYNNDEDMQKLEEEFIEVCSYIGKHMDIGHCKKWIDIMEGVQKFIDSSAVNIDDTLELCGKMCIVCKNLHETKQMPIKKLREHVIKYFEQKDINAYKTKMFNDLLPSVNNESYNIACNIAGTIVYYTVMIERMDFEDKNIFHVSNHLRLCIEYITRRDIYIENGINRDCDCVWFLWGVLMNMSTQNKQGITISHQLFKHKWKQSIKKRRIGILWGSVFLMIFSRKGVNINMWSHTDMKVFQQIRTMSPAIMNTIKEKLKAMTNKTEPDNINIIMQYTPKTKDKL